MQGTGLTEIIPMIMRESISWQVIREVRSPKRRERGLGALKEEMGSGVLGGEKDKLFFLHSLVLVT